MLKFRKTVCGEEFTVVKKNDGAWFVTLIEKNGQVYFEILSNFTEVGSWIWNMADNHDIANEVCHKMCDKLGMVLFADGWGYPS